ncbi:MAG: hypothetical protein JW915_16395 [Chitinispirillaceae bacterium]|nr:hypothetical protein [Chitinispirillaceae bacterium]
MINYKLLKDISNHSLKDDDLRLYFKEIKPATEPDTSVSAYHFSMQNIMTNEEMGGINIKTGYTENIEKYRGNIGFTVFEPYRGNHYSARSCILLLPVLKILEMNLVYLTCNLDNYASMKNIERIGAVYQETVTIPDDYPHLTYYPKDARIKIRYKWAIDTNEN